MAFSTGSTLVTSICPGTGRGSFSAGLGIIVVTADLILMIRSKEPGPIIFVLECRRLVQFLFAHIYIQFVSIKAGSGCRPGNGNQFIPDSENPSVRDDQVYYLAIP